MSETSAKHQQGEALSALFDGEALELELRRVLKTAADDSDVNGRWTRYQMISASMKNEMPAVPFADLSSSISAAIANEPVHTTTAAANTAVSSKKSFWSGVGRFAVAASVAGAVVLGVQFAPNDLNNQVVDSTPSPVINNPASSIIDQSSGTQVRTVSEINNVPTKQQIIINENTQQQIRKEVEPQVNRLMLEHAQNASQNTQQGVLPYVRVPESSEAN